MTLRKTDFLVIDDLRGGRNGGDPFLSLKANQVVEARNVDYYHTRLGRKRGGASDLSLTFSSNGPFADSINALIRHVPGTDDSAAELWAVDGTNQIGRLAGATTWTEPTLKDAQTGNSWDTYGASLNGKLFLAYKSAQNRLHVWDGSTVRRTGINPGSNAPTVGNTGSGSYAAVLRYYRVRFIEVAGGIVVRRSEPTPSVSFTPSGTGTAARVTQPTVPSEGETHWEVEVSLDNITFYTLSASFSGNIAIGTTTYDDSVATTLYSTAATAKATGTFTLQKSYKFLAADQSRLLGYGSWTSTDKQNRVEFSAVFASLDVGDTERVDTTLGYYVDLDESDSGAATGIVGPCWGNFYAFKFRQMWELSPTGDPYRPYRAVCISKTIGCVAPKTLTIGEDPQGNPALYFLSERGPYRYGVRGLEYIGHEIEDVTQSSSAGGFTSSIVTSVNTDIGVGLVGHAVYHTAKRQWWLWFSQVGSSFPGYLVVYHLDANSGGGGWSFYNNGTANFFGPESSRCSVMFADTVGATMGHDLKPYAGKTSNTVSENGGAGAPHIWKLDTGTTDVGTTFPASILTRPIEPAGPYTYVDLSDVLVGAQMLSAVTLTVSTFVDYRDPAQAASASGTALLTQDASIVDRRKLLRAEGSEHGHVLAVMYRIGDASAADTGSWSLDRLVIPYKVKEALTG